MEYVDVIVDISHEKLDRVFQYRVPEALSGKIRIGMQVSFPFGRGNRPMKGYVTGITEEPDYPPEKIKELDGIVEGSVCAESQLIALAAWMREQYGSTMNQALKTVLPVKQEVARQRDVTLRLIISREEAEEQLRKELKKNNRTRARLLAALLDADGTITKREAAERYRITAPVIRGLERDDVLKSETQTRYRNPFEGHFKKRAEVPELSAQQRAAVDGIWADYERGERRTCLLQGVTGSGKTEVYMALIERVIRQGKQAIVLIPEIALTYQTVRRFYERFGARVSVLHSRLSDGERYDQFVRAKEGQLDVMIGPRSALFTPFSDLGMIIIDEEHEGAYKSETVPRYDAREAAIYRASLCGASVVLGSATPSLESSYRAREGVYGWYRLDSRIGTAVLPQVEIIDLREELREGNRGIFSRKLTDALSERLRRGEQAMLFLNRRGFSGFVSCRSCGEALRCPHCDVSLSLHTDGYLKCHYCGYEMRMPKKCPSCGSPYISGFRAGTQQIEREVKRLFPAARVLRMDYDTTRAKESYETILSAFGRGEADVLVGTQMIVKGHDFPNVTLVGVVAADISLHAPDYRAAERTFTLLTQAVGRAGRAEKPGEALIQTYRPEHYSIRAAARQDYDAFYEQELSYRRLMAYPPVQEMLGIYLSCEEQELLKQRAEELGAYIRAQDPALQVIGPAVAALSKKNDIYRMVIYIKYERKERLLEIKRRLECRIKEEPQWDRVRVQFDYNPQQSY
ncbi:MAG: primosomal protein N' [Lachnospiraceae bacterium]|nr:primosomal protein N' [Lachnospiraceae bacterium]